MGHSLFNPDESGQARGYRNIVQSVVTDCQKSFVNFNKQKCFTKNKHTGNHLNNYKYSVVF